MKIIIAGSRSITDEQDVANAITASLPTLGQPVRGDLEIVSGTAKGVDQLGEQIARKEGIPVKRFPAEWDKFGKSAGYKRNVQMAEYADALVAVWDGESKGTSHMIDIMNRLGKPVYVHCVTLPEIAPI